MVMPLRIWRKPLDADKIKGPQAEIHIIKERCKGCNFCIEYCPKDVLEESEEFNEKGFHLPKVKDETKCVICGFCEVVCPDFAIFSIEKNCKKEEG